MASSYRTQNDFSGGEVSLRMSMRDDTEVWGKSVSVMENFVPTLQGSAERSPGTEYVEEMDALDARIIPYLSPTNERSLVKITAGSISFIPDVANRFDPDVIIPPDSGFGTVNLRRQIMENGLIQKGLFPWTIDPPEYDSRNGDGPLGLRWQGTFIHGAARLFTVSTDFITCTISGECTIPKDTAVLTIEFKIRYFSNTPLRGDYTCHLRVGKSVGASDIGEWDFKDFSSGVVGGIAEESEDRTVNMLAGETVYLTATWTAIESDEERYSTPRFGLDYFLIWADDDIEIGDGSIVGTVPYAADELQDLHFIQSPLMPFNPGEVSKELVIVHPNHEPYKLYFDTNNLQFEFNPIDFVPTRPNTWGPGNFPATCGSFLGRLVLAGSQGRPDVGDPISGDTETVWCTEVGKWNTFSDSVEVNPDDSIEFTTTYRSPIQWVYGQKDLLIGALEMEYIGSADGIFQPADLGVNMHSTHGSTNVQPAGFGENVFFPAEGGTKVRSMSKSADDDGWLARDMTIANPDICKSGILRMVRMRNPHQMLVVLLGTGELGVLHYDNYASVSGWSRIAIAGTIRDVAVMANSSGVDILFVTVLRKVNGINKLFLEAFVNWVDDSSQLGYLLSSIRQDFAGSQSFMDGLDHLEGEKVKVTVDGGNYIGTYTVTAGRIDFIDAVGNPISYNSAHAGLRMSCVLFTLPIPGLAANSKKLYSEISVRIHSSTIPSIGVEGPDDALTAFIFERPPTRSSQENMGENSKEYLLRNVTIQNRGWNTGQMVRIAEDIPQRVEILAIFGRLTENVL